MSHFKYSYNAIVYHQEEISKGVARVARYGYDAIELVGEPTTHNVDEINNLTDDAGIKVSSICSIWFGDERDLINPDAANRQRALDYGKSVADFAAAVGAPTIIVGPSPVGKTAALATDEEEWAWAVDSVRNLGEYAATMGVNITLEPWNRYETHFLNRLDRAVELLDATGLKNGGVHGDVFHMNIEEETIGGAFTRAGSNVNHVHLADSNRAAPGVGHTDFKPILQALKDINYDGYLTFELLPAASNPFAMMARGGHLEFLDKYTEKAITEIKALEQELWPNE